MKSVLITGGTAFVSRYVAEYYVKKCFAVTVLNRNRRTQCAGVELVEGDRHALGDKLRGRHYDAILDITAYDASDVNDLLDALDSFDSYILISSSAVYPETAPQPFTEETSVGMNRIWGKYGIGKIAAEKALQDRIPDAYILRPPYLYGPGNNVYREAFVFDCAMQGRKFYLPKDGEMKLQFFHVEDLCRFMDVLLEKRPQLHIFNVGNRETISVREWVKLCYEATGSTAEFKVVNRGVEQRSYFPFYDYAYYLDVDKQYSLMPETKSLYAGIVESFQWYSQNQNMVNRKPYISFIDENL